MILKMYAFFDRVSQNFIPQVMLIPSNEVCLRGMKKLVNSPQFPHKDIIEDLQLFCLGEFDQENGTITSSKEFMLNLVDLMEVEK